MCFLKKITIQPDYNHNEIKLVGFSWHLTAKNVEALNPDIQYIKCFHCEGEEWALIMKALSQKKQLKTLIFIQGTNHTTQMNTVSNSSHHWRS